MRNIDLLLLGEYISIMKSYEQFLLNNVQDLLGEMFETSTTFLGVSLQTIWKSFCFSKISISIADGDASLIMGKSGSEIAFELCNKRINHLPYIHNETKEYVFGKNVAYYQWSRNIPFISIYRKVDIKEFFDLFSLPIEEFCKKLDTIMKDDKKETLLKIRRKEAGKSQRELAELSFIPIRTIQQYEQRQKSINKASAIYIISLAKALCCRPEELLEL